ncbi:hypothetical protein BDZ97DRAFT_1675759 [Flammula alnicola]|nr:hypothetical protein BDZ97DRAFT_1675759 [Flammula alnicola]
MVNPGAFRGSRKEFLMNEKANYSAGVAGGYAAEALAIIQRRYFKRYPIDLPHDEEPAAGSLDAVDDDAPDPETCQPDPERLSMEEYAAAMAQIAERKKLVAYRKAQIKRWMAYQYMKDNDLNPKDSGAYNPYHALMAKLTGKEVNRPRCKTGVNNRLGDLKGKKDRLAAERDKIAREMFAKLDEEEQRSWKVVAMDEHSELMKEYKKDAQLANTPSTDPADRQRCIQGLVRFTQPILDMICDVTGWKATLIAGGPEPAQDGQLNIISIHSGTTTGDVKMNFGRAERERYKKSIIPIYGSFLRKCYTPEECRARALSTGDGFMPMSAMGMEDDNVAMFSVDIPSPAVAVGASPGPSPTHLRVHAGSRAHSLQPSPGPTPPHSRGPSPAPFLPAVNGDVHPSTPSTAEAGGSEVGPTGVAETRMPEVQGTKRGRQTSNVNAEALTDAEQPPKRCKTSTNVALPVLSTSTPLSAPVNAPKWFARAVDMVDSADLGPEWAELVRKWFAFEVQQGYKEAGKLGTKSRPSSVYDWIQRGRAPKWRPKITNLTTYGTDCMKWPGPNGLLSIIACLLHWGDALKKKGQTKNGDWLVVVKDCTTVYTHLLLLDA